MKKNIKAVIITPDNYNLAKELQVHTGLEAIPKKGVPSSERLFKNYFICNN
jgi:hypothetical protein